MKGITVLAVALMVLGSAWADEPFMEVDDGRIAGVRHDTAAGTLSILFSDGSVVTHEGLPELRVAEFMAYSSREHFYDNIIRSGYAVADRGTVERATLTDAAGGRRVVVFDAASGNTDRFSLRVGADWWHTQGSGQWKIRFGRLDPAVGAVIGRSELSFDDIDANSAVLSATATFDPCLRVSGRYGVGTISDGEASDTDLLDVPGAAVEGFLLSEQAAMSDGETEQYDVNVHLVLSSLFPCPYFRGSVDLFAGYQYYRDDLDLTDGFQTKVNNAASTSRFSDALDSTYEFEWKALRLGVAAEVPLGDHLTVSGYAAYLSDVEYKGEGYWNLREDYRTTSPNFAQESDTGHGLDAQIAIAYQVGQVGMRLGYWVISWKADSGQDTIYLADGSVLGSRLEEVETERHGAFFGVFAEL